MGPWEEEAQVPMSHANSLYYAMAIPISVSTILNTFLLKMNLSLATYISS